MYKNPRRVLLLHKPRNQRFLLVQLYCTISHIRSPNWCSCYTNPKMQQPPVVQLLHQPKMQQPSLVQFLHQPKNVTTFSVAVAAPTQKWMVQLIKQPKKLFNLKNQQPWVMQLLQQPQKALSVVCLYKSPKISNLHWEQNVTTSSQKSEISTGRKISPSCQK